LHSILNDLIINHIKYLITHEAFNNTLVIMNICKLYDNVVDRSNGGPARFIGPSVAEPLSSWATAFAAYIVFIAT
jgi:hypothetical protein